MEGGVEVRREKGRSAIRERSEEEEECCKGECEGRGAWHFGRQRWCVEMRELEGRGKGSGES